MGLFNLFPYSNFHEMNLDWIIAKVKELEEKVKGSGVLSFNGRTGDVSPQSGDYTATMVGARPANWTPTASDVGAVPTSSYNPVGKTAEMTQPVGRDSDGQLWTAAGGGGSDFHTVHLKSDGNTIWLFDDVDETPLTYLQIKAYIEDESNIVYLTNGNYSFYNKYKYFPQEGLNAIGFVGETQIDEQVYSYRVVINSDDEVKADEIPVAKRGYQREITLTDSSTNPVNAYNGYTYVVNGQRAGGLQDRHYISINLVDLDLSSNENWECSILWKPTAVAYIAVGSMSGLHVNFSETYDTEAGHTYELNLKVFGDTLYILMKEWEA